MNNKAEKGNAVGEGQGIHVVAKLIGPGCNLNCEYCFYLEKQALFAAGEQYRMSDKVLSAFITHYITSQPTPVVEFVWQGGEPTLLGIEWLYWFSSRQPRGAARSHTAGGSKWRCG